MMTVRRVDDDVLRSLREEAEAQLAEPDHEDPVIANYDYPAQVSPRDLIAVLDELKELRTRLSAANRKYLGRLLDEYWCAARESERQESVAFHANTRPISDEYRKRLVVEVDLAREKAAKTRAQIDQELNALFIGKEEC